MLLNLLHTITDLVVFVICLRVEGFADEQRMTLIDQSILLQGFGAAFEFDLHDHDPDYDSDSHFLASVG